MGGRKFVAMFAGLACTVMGGFLHGSPEYFMSVGAVSAAFITGNAFVSAKAVGVAAAEPAVAGYTGRVDNPGG